MTKDESRAVAFLGVLLLLATVARLLNRPDPIAITASPIDVAALQEAGRKLSRQPPPPRKGKQRPAPPRRAAADPVYIVETGPLDLNRASAEDIERLPFIGPAMAQRIVARRDSVRRFRSLEELDSIKGVGPALIEKLRPLVVVR